MPCLIVGISNNISDNYRELTVKRQTLARIRDRVVLTNVITNYEYVYSIDDMRDMHANCLFVDKSAVWSLLYE